MEVVRLEGRLVVLELVAMVSLICWILVTSAISLVGGRESRLGLTRLGLFSDSRRFCGD